MWRNVRRRKVANLHAAVHSLRCAAANGIFGREQQISIYLPQK
jgi:hypothetical protein